MPFNKHVRYCASRLPVKIFATHAITRGSPYGGEETNTVVNSSPHLQHAHVEKAVEDALRQRQPVLGAKNRPPPDARIRLKRRKPILAPPPHKQQPVRASRKSDFRPRRALKALSPEFVRYVLLSPVKQQVVENARSMRNTRAGVCRVLSVSWTHTGKRPCFN